MGVSPYMNKNKNIFTNTESGAGMLEVLLTIAIIALIAPFLYFQISDISREVRDTITAKKIVSLQDVAMNFVRLYENDWPENVQIKLSAEELARISPDAIAGFIDKYEISGNTVNDIYLVFNVGDAIRAARVQKYIGSDAAVTGTDNVANSETWAASAPEFMPGDLVYRINHDSGVTDMARFLHRTTTGDDELNVMFRPLNMGRFGLYNIGTVSGESAKIKMTQTAFTETEELRANTMYFNSGALMDASDIHIGNLRVGGDITGFRNITAMRLGGTESVATGNVIADRATVNNSITVGKNMSVKSDASRTISAFSAISAHSASVPYIISDEMDFYNNFGLTVSAELLFSSSSAPLKLGNWTFHT